MRMKKKKLQEMMKKNELDTSSTHDRALCKPVWILDRVERIAAANNILLVVMFGRLLVLIYFASLSGQLNPIQIDQHSQYQSLPSLISFPSSLDLCCLRF